MAPDAVVALYVLDGGITVLHDFSDDARSLRAAVDRYEARTLGVYDASQESGGDPAPSDTRQVWLVDPAASANAYFMDRRAHHSFKALQALAGHLSGIAGRKNVVWVSEPGLHELRIVGRDVPSGRVGSLIIPAARLK